MPPLPSPRPGRARFGGVQARGVFEVVDVRAEPEALRRPGWWALVGDFEGPVRAWRFAQVAAVGHAGAPGSDEPPPDEAPWHGPAAADWTTSLDEQAYVAGVTAVRERIRAGDVYQANLCRVLSAPALRGDAAGLARVLAAGNPAPYAGYIDVPPGPDDDGTWLVTASPELFLAVSRRRVSSGPIKGTALEPAGLTDKDRAENVMITDLVRNDLAQVCEPGTVRVDHLLAVERHPGLTHLVSTVSGRLAAAVIGAPDLWRRLLDATYPPGSVSGAPKSTALRVIRELEPVPRGPYCGLVGWVRVSPGGAVRARLAVGIRTFWWSDGALRFGTGAGITWGSDPRAEWAETELKASRLVALASGEGGVRRSGAWRSGR